MFCTEIKLAARISHNLLDAEIKRIEEYACAELIRAGVPETQITPDNILVKNAIITRVLMDIGNEKSYDKAKESWEYQLDNLRKHDWTVERGAE